MFSNKCSDFSLAYKNAFLAVFAVANETSNAVFVRGSFAPTFAFGSTGGGGGSTSFPEGVPAVVMPYVCLDLFLKPSSTYM